MSTDLIQEEYKVQLEVFEGPLDLLLYLIRKNEVDIYDIPIGTIAKQYLDYLDLMKMLDLNIAGDFIVMASTLMVIKSRLLLPVDDRPEEEQEEEEDPRWDLVRQLVEYKKFKDAAGYLEELAHYQENVFSREGEHLELGPQPDLNFEEVGIFDLITSLNQALARVKDTSGEIFAERFTVADKVDTLMEMTREGAAISVTDLFRGMQVRAEIVCTFLAMLELIKLNELTVAQDEHFGEIVVQRAEEPLRKTHSENQ
jgi:segregation and condensation protein A